MQSTFRMDVVGNKGWAGSSIEERRAERRAKLIAAARALLAEGGGPACSVRAVCRTSGVTERYFYENFTDRDDLVVTAYDEIAGDIIGAILQAVMATDGTPEAVATAAVETAVSAILDDNEKAQVLFVAIVSDPILYAKIDEFGPMLSGIIRTQLTDHVSDEHADLVATSLAGALGHLFHQYVRGGLTVSREAFVQHCVSMLLTLAAMPTPEPAPPSRRRR